MRTFAGVLLLLFFGSTCEAKGGEAECSAAGKERLRLDDGNAVLSLLQGQAQAKPGRSVVGAQGHEVTVASGAAAAKVYRKPNTTAAEDDDDPPPPRITKVFDLLLGLYGFIVLAVLVRELAVRKQDEESTWTSCPTNTWRGLQCILQLALFCQHSGRQPFAMEGVLFMMTGASMAMEMKTCATIKDHIKCIAGRMLGLIPAYWMVLGLSFAVSAEGFNPLEQLVKMPYLHSVDFFAANAVTSQWSSYWFVSTLLAFCLYFPIVDFVLRRIGTRDSVGCCFMLMALCYKVQCVLAAYLLSTDYMPEYDMYAGFSIFARAFNGFPVAFCMNPITRLPEFVMGILAGHALHALSAAEEKGNAICERTRRRLAWAADVSAVLLLAIVSVGVYFIVALSSHHPNGTFRVISRMNLLSPLWALLILGSGCGDPSGVWPSFIKSMFELQPLQLFGEATVAFYLSHIFVLHSTNCFSAKNKPKCEAGALTTYFAYSMVMAAIVYRIIEEPVREYFKSAAVAAEVDDKAHQPVKQAWASSD